MSVIVKTHTLTPVGEPDIALNESQARYLVKLQTTGNSHNDNNIPTTYYIDGVRYTKTHKLPLNSTTTVVDKTVTITHNPDGTRTVNASFSTPTGISAGTITGSKSLTLPTIPRASEITVNDANIGSSTNIVINKASDNFKTTIYYKANGQDDFTKIVDKTSNQVYGWTVPTSFYALIPSSKTITCQFYAETYNEDTLIGTSSTITATFTAIGDPIINNSSAVDTNATTIALTGDNTKMVRYASNVQVSVSASGQNSATISTITVNGANVTLSGTDPKTGTIILNSVNSNTFTMIVTDSRGYTKTQTLTMDMVDYVPLTINATIKRNQPTDNKVNINFSGNYFNDTFGDENNTLSVQYRYKESTSSTWGNWTNLTATLSGNTYSGTEQISNINYQNIYNFEIRALDEINTKTITGITISKGEPVYWWDDETFNVNGDITQNGSPIIEQDSNANGSYIKYADGTMIQMGKKNIGNVTCDIAFGNLFRSDYLGVVSFPETFVSIESCEVHLENVQYASFLTTEGTATLSSSQSFYLIRATSSSVTNVVVGCHAIGKWK